MITKSSIENMLGLLLTDEQYIKAQSMASSKLNYIINKFGDANGERRKEEYYQELIYEAAIQNLFFDALFAEIMIDMKRVPDKRSTLND